nr:hypothetical protein BCS91_26295 [Vibrio cyclitrophicus]
MNPRTIDLKTGLYLYDLGDLSGFYTGHILVSRKYFNGLCIAVFPDHRPQHSELDMTALADCIESVFENDMTVRLDYTESVFESGMTARRDYTMSLFENDMTAQRDYMVSRFEINMTVQRDYTKSSFDTDMNRTQLNSEIYTDISVSPFLFS